MPSGIDGQKSNNEHKWQNIGVVEEGRSSFLRIAEPRQTHLAA
jgi:hypothetical protein